MSKGKALSILENEGKNREKILYVRGENREFPLYIQSVVCPETKGSGAFLYVFVKIR